jgi:hypothetical protein
VIPQLRNLPVSGNIAADTTLSGVLSHKEKGPGMWPFLGVAQRVLSIFILLAFPFTFK